MTDSTAVPDILARVVAWASARDDVAAVALVGSHARESAGSDSDVDLVVLTPMAERYVADTSWAADFGVVRRIAVEHYGALVSVRVVYESGPEVEFGFADPRWASEPLDPGTAGVLEGGMRVMYEREPLLSPLAHAKVAPEPAKVPGRGTPVSLEQFFAGFEESLPLFEAVRAAVASVGPSDMRVTKSQVSFSNGRAFAWTWMPERYMRGPLAPLVLSIGLPDRDTSPRWKEVVEPAPRRFVHHLEVRAVSDIDEQVRDWLRAAWENAPSRRAGGSAK